MSDNRDKRGDREMDWPTVQRMLRAIEVDRHRRMQARLRAEERERLGFALALPLLRMAKAGIPLPVPGAKRDSRGLPPSEQGEDE